MPNPGFSHHVGLELATAPLISRKISRLPGETHTLGKLFSFQARKPEYTKRTQRTVSCVLFIATIYAVLESATYQKLGDFMRCYLWFSL